MESPFDSIPGHRAYGEGPCHKRILIAFNYVPAESARYDPHQWMSQWALNVRSIPLTTALATTKLG